MIRRTPKVYVTGSSPYVKNTRYKEVRMQHRKAAFRKKAWWTFFCSFIYIGSILILFWIGIFINDRYLAEAAEGQSDAVVPTQIPGRGGAEWTLPWEERGSIDQQIVSAPTSTPTPIVPEPTRIPDVTPEIVQVVPATATSTSPAPTPKPSLITRISIPSVKIDRKVVQIGWHTEEGTNVQVWDVDKFRVGHNIGSANPGDGSNIVLSGHSGGKNYPFNDLYWVKPGDKITLYEGEKAFVYKVVSHDVVDEDNASPEQKTKNAQFLEPTNHEVVTMIACWPLTGPDKFTQRVIIRAEPQ